MAEMAEKLESACKFENITEITEPFWYKGYFIEPNIVEHSISCDMEQFQLNLLRPDTDHANKESTYRTELSKNIFDQG